MKNKDLALVKTFLCIGSLLLAVACSKKEISPIPGGSKCLVLLSKADDGSTTYVYNSSGQLISEPFSAATGNYGRSYEYDTKGNLIKQSSGLGTFISTYDQNNLLTGQSYFSNTGLERTFTFEYNNSSQLIKQTQVDVNGTKATLVYTYPSATSMNPQNMTYYVNDVLYSFETYEYDTKYPPKLLYPSIFPHNNLTKFTKANSPTNPPSLTYSYTYQYNDAGYPISSTFSDGLSKPYITTYTYQCN